MKQQWAYGQAVSDITVGVMTAVVILFGLWSTCCLGMVVRAVINY